MDTKTADILPDDMSRPDATGRDSEPYTISVTEAAELFTQSGLPRTERAIQRFCKKGDLLCAFQETAYGSRYLIRRSSIDRLIQQKLQALAVTPDSEGRDVSRQDATIRDTSRHEIEAPSVDNIPEPRTTTEMPVIEGRDTPPRHVATDADPEALQKLREENLGLKIDNAARQQFINHLSTALEKSAKEVQELSYNLGVAHTRVAQLEAPRPVSEARAIPGDDTSRPVATTDTASVVAAIETKPEREGDVISSEPAPSASAAPEPPPRSFWRTIFG